MAICTCLFGVEAQAQSNAARTLHFPDKSVGQLRKAVMGIYGYYIYSEPFFDAKGSVKIPADTQLLLYANYYGATHLSFLEKLKPDDLVGLCLRAGSHGFETVNDESLAPLTHLTGLQDIDLTGSDAGDGALRLLSTMPSIRAIRLEGTMITADGTKSLAKLTKLNHLSLSFTAAGDTGLRNIAPLKELWSLQLRRCGVTDAGMAELRNMTHLKSLNISFSKVGDKGIAALPTMPDLIEIFAGDSWVGDQGLACMGKFPSLNHLDLLNCKITQKGLKSLSCLKKLKSLNVAGNEFTLEELQCLKSIPSLKRVTVTFAPSRADALKKSLPGINVIVDNHHSNLNKDKLPLDLFAPLH